MQHRDRWTISV